MSPSLKVTAITGGKNEPSARFRVRQYISSLSKHNVHVTEHYPYISKSGSYWYHKYSFPLQLLPQIGIAGLRVASRIPAVINSHLSDVTLIQREFFTAFPTTEGLTKSPRLFDVDDAIWLRLKLTSAFAKRIVHKMDGLICGNAWIADYFSDCDVPTWIIPTGVDTVRWNSAVSNSNSTFYLGWIGTSGNYQYIYDIEQALFTFLNKYPSAKLLIVSDRKPKFLRLSPKKIHFLQWSREVEVNAVQLMSVGLMPLKNTDWEKGKCAFKMLQYMATGIPVVVSPVGMNQEVLARGTIGFGPTSHSDWVDALTVLYENSGLRKQMGLTGRRVVKDHYSLNEITPQLAAIFHQFS